MATSQRSLSSDDLRPINALTNMSKQPGNLDYDAYRQYLARIGHIKARFNVPGFVGPATPQNTLLQSREGDRDDDKTDCRFDQVLWSQDNLPNIIYIFVKPESWLEKHQLEEPPFKTYEIYGAKLRDLPILPDHISSKVEGWRIEAWFRLDPRLNLMDVIERMEPDRRPSNKSVVQMRTLRFRKDCKVLGWVALGKNFDTRRGELQREMYDDGIDLTQNSTRGMSWGLKNPSLGAAGGRVVVPANRRQGSTVDITRIPLTPVMSNATVSPFLSTPRTHSLSIPASILKNNQQLRQNQFINDNKAFNNHTFQSPNLFIHTTNPYLTSTIAMAAEASSSTDPPPRRSPRSQPQPRSQLQGQLPLPPFSSRQPTPLPPTPVTVNYFSKPLTLKTPEQRARDTAIIARLKQEWHPVGSEGRRLQLAYLLDPVLAPFGFVDNRGWWPPIGNWECIDADIVYN